MIDSLDSGEYLILSRLYLARADADNARCHKSNKTSAQEQKCLSKFASDADEVDDDDGEDVVF